MAEGRTRTATFLLTDIEESTRGWEAEPRAMRAAIRRHDEILRSSIHAHEGRVRTSKGEGDSFFAVFRSARQAVAAACEAQTRLAAERWPAGIDIRVRMALNSGEAPPRDERGPVVNRSARLKAAAHGGQVLLTKATADLCDRLPALATLHPLGEHRLRDLSQPVTVYELRHPGLRGGFPPIRTLSRHAQNLPMQLTSFIGRAAELDELKQVLPRTRLLTIAGVGGSGKTRLAVQLAAEVLDRYQDGAWFVDLSPLADAALLPQALAAALAIREPVEGDLVAAIGRELAGERCQLNCLVILDNCEHLAGPCAALAERLLQTCSQLTILATSRQPLHVPGETAWRVPALSLAAASEQALDSDAVQLFGDRARLSAPDFALGEAQAAQVADICRRLDGLPLAIELVAAQAGLFSLDRLQAELGAISGLGSRQTSIPRQRTLEMALDWSFRLLDAAERRLFRRLAVFSGGFTVEAVMAVCMPAERRVLELLAGLIDKSLVQRTEPAPGQERYRLLETTRDFAERRLRRGRDGAEVRARHFEHYLALAGSASAGLREPSQAQWLDRLSEEHDNLRSAMDYGRDRSQERMRLALALSRFWSLRGHLTEGRQALADAVASASEPSTLRAEVLNAIAGFAWNQGDQEGARSYLESSLADSRALGDRARMQPCLANLGVMASGMADFEGARDYFERSLKLARELGDERAAAILLTNLGLVEAELGRYEEARSTLLESIELKSRVGDPAMLVNSLINLGIALVGAGRMAEGRGRFAEALAIVRQIGDAVNLANCLEGFGWLASLAGDHPRALRLAAAAAGLRQAIGARHSSTAQRLLDRWLPQSRSSLGPEAAQAAWQDGLKLTRDQAADLAISL